MNKSKILKLIIWSVLMLCGVFAYAQTDGGFDPLTATFEQYYQYYVVGGTIILGQLLKTFGIKESPDVTKILTIAGTAFVIVLLIQNQGIGSVIPDGIIAIMAALGIYSSGKKVGKSANGTLSAIKTIASNIEEAKAQAANLNKSDES